MDMTRAATSGIETLYVTPIVELLTGHRGVDSLRGMLAPCERNALSVTPRKRRAFKVRSVGWELHPNTLYVFAAVEVEDRVHALTFRVIRKNSIARATVIGILTTI